MARLNSARFRWILFFTTSLAGAQTAPELAKILERLDRLERDNRALTEEVRTLRARLDGVVDNTAAPAAATPEPAEATPAPAPPPVTLEERVAIQEERTAELAQTK